MMKTLLTSSEPNDNLSYLIVKLNTSISSLPTTLILSSLIIIKISTIFLIVRWIDRLLIGLLLSFGIYENLVIISNNGDDDDNTIDSKLTRLDSSSRDDDDDDDENDVYSLKCSLKRLVLTDLCKVSDQQLLESQNLRVERVFRFPCYSTIYKPTPWLFNGHLQTIYSALGNFSHTDQLVFERKIIQVPDGGRIALDFTPPGSFDDIADQRSVLITLHGLTGGSHESYVRSVLSPLTSSNRWRAVVLNFRGCAGSQVTTPKLYHAGASDELRLVIRFLKTLIAPDTKVHGIGFSLGANVLAKYLGEESGRSFIRSGVVVGNPWDLYAGHCHLESGPIKRFYSRALASNLRTMFSRHIRVFKNVNRSFLTKTSTTSLPEGPVDFNDLDLIDIDALYSNPNQSLYEFDSIVTKTLLNLPSTEHYYKYNSSTRVVEAVRVPLLSINSIDDPIVSIDAVPIEATISNPNLVMMISKKGGHLGWFEGFWRPRRVIHRPITDWLNSMDQNMKKTRRRDPIKEIDKGKGDDEGSITVVDDQKGIIKSSDDVFDKGIIRGL